MQKKEGILKPLDNSFLKKLARINKDVVNIIDRIVWRWKWKNINDDYRYRVCVLGSPGIRSNIFMGCRAVGINRSKVSYRILKPMMRVQDRFVYSFKSMKPRPINDLTPDKRLISLPINYVYTSTRYLKRLRISLRDSKTKSCDRNRDNALECDSNV